MPQQVIKMPRREVKSLERGEQFWIRKGESDELLIFIAYLPDHEDGPVIRAHNASTTWDVSIVPDVLQKQHDAWCEQVGSWKVKAFGKMEQNQTLYFADRYYDPTRYVGWAEFAWHVPRQWPEFWKAFIDLLQTENDENYSAFATAQQAMQVKYAAEFP